MQRIRCSWALEEPNLAYHDGEWGVPLHDDRRHFEFIVLDGAQAGLSWATILRKREGYRRAFAGFDAAKVARFTDDDVGRLLRDPGIVRNRAKVLSAIRNAQAFVELVEAEGSFDAFIWQFVGGEPRINSWERMEDVPATTAESEAMSRALKKRGFNFVGPTICYAYMQAAGMVNDHLVSCFRHRELAP